MFLPPSFFPRTKRKRRLALHATLATYLPLWVVSKCFRFSIRYGNEFRRSVESDTSSRPIGIHRRRATQGGLPEAPTDSVATLEHYGSQSKSAGSGSFVSP